MFEETRKYTEAVYYSKAMLAEHMEGMVLEAVWKQVETYRNLFRRTFAFSFYQGSIVMSVSCMRKLQYASELLYQCRQQDAASLPIRKALLRLEMQRDWLRKMQEVLELKALPMDAYAFLSDEEEPLLLRMFFLYIIKADISVYGSILLLHANCQASVSMLTWKGDITAEDLTVSFLSFLDAVCLQISQSMLSLAKTSRASCQTMQLQELLEYFPMLSERQIMFYVDHRTPHCSYTIRQFMEYAGVCHETARCSMEQLVDMQCYTRRKLGKKYIYETL